MVALTRAREAARHLALAAPEQTDQLEPVQRLADDVADFFFSGIVVRGFWFGGDDVDRTAAIGATASAAGAEIKYRVIDK